MTICCALAATESLIWKKQGEKKEAAAQRQTAEITLALNYAAREQQQSLMLPTEMIQKSRQQQIKIIIDEKAANNTEWDPLVSVASVAFVAVQASAGTLLLLTCRSRREGGEGVSSPPFYFPAAPDRGWRRGWREEGMEGGTRGLF